MEIIGEKQRSYKDKKGADYKKILKEHTKKVNNLEFLKKISFKRLFEAIMTKRFEKARSCKERFEPEKVFEIEDLSFFNFCRK